MPIIPSVKGSFRRGHPLLSIHKGKPMYGKYIHSRSQNFSTRGCSKCATCCWLVVIATEFRHRSFGVTCVPQPSRQHGFHVFRSPWGLTSDFGPRTASDSDHRLSYSARVTLHTRPIDRKKHDARTFRVHLKLPLVYPKIVA